MNFEFYKPECGQWEFSFIPSLVLVKEDNCLSICFFWLFWAIEFGFEKE